MGADVDIETRGSVGWIRLARESGLNALTYDMVRVMDEALQACAADTRIDYVVVSGAGERAFCAGGDIIGFYEAMDAGRGAAYARQFLSSEYVMNYRMHTYPKPLVSLMHGIVMGGGVGASAHASVRIAFSDLRLALPECAIGFIPDVGSSYILARAPHALGKYVGLTGVRLSAADAVYCGFADMCVDISDYCALHAALLDGEGVSAVERFAYSPSPSFLQQHAAWLGGLFGGGDIVKIMARLESEDSPIARQALQAMRHNSWLCMRLFLRAYDYAGGCSDLSQALAYEYRITSRLGNSREFYEGVRAQVIDKDKNPRWHYGIADVDESLLDEFTAETEVGLKF